MQQQTDELTPDQILWGEFYSFIHQLAEGIRVREATSGNGHWQTCANCGAVYQGGSVCGECGYDNG